MGYTYDPQYFVDLKVHNLKIPKPDSINVQCALYE